MKTLDKYVVSIEGTDGLIYTLENDGGNGPMSTGTDEWIANKSWEGIGRIMSLDKAMEVFNQPNRGYGKAPMGRIIVSRIGLIPELEREVPDENALVKATFGAAARMTALAKLTPAERKALGF